jgi:hypothetical protein
VDTTGSTLQLNLPASVPGATWVLVSDYANKTVSLVLVNPGGQHGNRISVWEVQDYTQVGA